jgi:hypothetical protein
VDYNNRNKFPNSNSTAHNTKPEYFHVTKLKYYAKVNIINPQILVHLYIM